MRRQAIRPMTSTPFEPITTDCKTRTQPIREWRYEMRTPSALLGGLAIVAAVAACGSPASSLQSAPTTTMHGEMSCSSASLADQLSAQVKRIPGTIIVEGALVPTNKAEKIALDGGGTTVATLFTMKAAKTLQGSIPDSAPVWVEGGTVDGLIMQTETDVFAAPDGSGVFVITPSGLPGRLTAIYGFPLTAGLVTTGLGCPDTHPVPGATAVAGVDAVSGGSPTNRLSSATASPGSTPRQLPVANFEDLVRQAAK